MKSRLDISVVPSFSFSESCLLSVIASLLFSKWSNPEVPIFMPAALWCQAGINVAVVTGPGQTFAGTAQAKARLLPAAFRI